MSKAAVVEPDPDPTQVEVTKDRSSIKLMDLPMTKKNKDKNKDTTTLTDTNSSSSEHTKHQQQHSSSSSSSSSISSTKTKKRSTAANIEHDPDPSFLPADNNEDENNATTTTATKKQHADSTDKDSQDNVHTSSESIEEEEGDHSSKKKYRVGNPAHYETREERQIRIRKQFNQLDEHRSGYVDANSLVTFFADVTPDKNVQQRYADELLQLCHSRALRRNRTNSNGQSGTHHHRNSNGQDDNTHNDDGLSDQSSFHGASSERGYSQNGDYSDRTSGSNYDSDRIAHNGRLRYDDFEVFVEEKEERLWNLFREIDHNNDNGMCQHFVYFRPLPPWTLKVLLSIICRVG